MNTELLIAAQKIVERIQAGLGIEDAAHALAQIVLRIEEEMEHESMYYEHQCENAAEEYDKMMKEVSS